SSSSRAAAGRGRVPDRARGPAEDDPCGRATSGRAGRPGLEVKRHPTAREGEVPGPPVRNVGPYEAVALLGKGSSGVVLLARRAGVERLFAVKLLADMDAEGLARLKREAGIGS